jgi:single-stranded DNA-binding protein
MASSPPMLINAHPPAGKPWVRLRVGCGKDESVQWLSVAVFGKAAEAAATLKKGDRVYAEGSIKLDLWRGQDGVERHGLSVASFKIERTHLIGRNRPKRNGDTKPRAQDKSSAAAAKDFDDQIPF